MLRIRARDSDCTSSSRQPQLPNLRDEQGGKAQNFIWNEDLTEHYDIKADLQVRKGLAGSKTLTMPPHRVLLAPVDDNEVAFDITIGKMEVI